jgi:HD-GYP domain-containing protein (c-di-GMP phosphodiesterase class II)
MLVAQVIPAADSLDAMTTTRAYRGAKSWDSAMTDLRRGAGTQWNPKVVEAAVTVLAAAPAEVQAAEAQVQQASVVA